MLGAFISIIRLSEEKSLPTSIIGSVLKSVIDCLKWWRDNNILVATI